MSNDSPHTRRGLNRRDFIKVGGCVAGAAGLPVIAAGKATANVGADGYPVLEIAKLAELAPGDTVAFNYPDSASPALLMRLSEAAEGGVGDDASVVAFSALCTHKGCAVSYKAEHGMLICPCHWSTFDPARDGSIVIGQASESLPRITLEVDNGTVRAIGVNSLIYGRHTNIL